MSINEWYAILYNQAVNDDHSFSVEKFHIFSKAFINAIEVASSAKWTFQSAFISKNE
jgi:hypothetical protein